MFNEYLLAPGTDQALGIQDPSRIDRPLNSSKLMSTISCTFRGEKKAADKVLLVLTLCFALGLEHPSGQWNQGNFIHKMTPQSCYYYLLTDKETEA